MTFQIHIKIFSKTEINRQNKDKESQVTSLTYIIST